MLQRKNPFLRKRSAPYSCGQRRHHPQTCSDVGVEINGLQFTNHLSAPPPQCMCALGTCPRRDETSFKGRGASSARPTSAPSSQRAFDMPITINMIGSSFAPGLFSFVFLRSSLETVMIFIHLGSVTSALRHEGLWN